MKPSSHTNGTYRRDLFNALEECHASVSVGYPQWLKALDKLSSVRAKKPVEGKSCRLTKAVDEYLKKASITK